MGTPALKQHKDLTGADLHEPKPHAASHRTGGVDALEYLYNQSVASKTWTVNHGLHKLRPHVSVQDTAHTTVVGSINFVSDMQLVITFSAAFSGTAFIS
jgi:hypothetical protein